MTQDIRPGGPAPRKLNGFEHLVAAAGYSVDGLRRLLREPAFRHEILFAAVLLGVLAIDGASAAALLIQLVLLAILGAIEAVNTAIELIVDRVSPEFSAFAKHAKDLGSFAVFSLVVANAAFCAAVLFKDSASFL
ncbi:diacylglycerol kinase [Aureimonas sp. ME7]|uniref:diacylglycerol kinase n=1 Tax=Aureimonas sp. ME7 TaxID=2744252 RepID=UPI0015F423C6|nr:diacylglycerol kinase [Aureimonas sp. ME7]